MNIDKVLTLVFLSASSPPTDTLCHLPPLIYKLVKYVVWFYVYVFTIYKGGIAV